jgi:glycosyltransferase involved in cell wall biosynthesis
MEVSTMRVLFVDAAHPGHFRHLPAHLAAVGHDVAFAHQTANTAVPAGVRALTYDLTRAPHPATHPYLRRFERSILGGLSAAKAARAWRAEGYRPEVIVAFSGWGPPFYLTDVWPEAKLVVYNDIWYWPHDSVYDFFPGRTPSVDRACRVIVSNAQNVWDLTAADRIMVTTRFQLAQFPTVLWPNISVIHDGIDTDTFAPAAPDAEPAGFRFGGLDLPGDTNLVTYVTRGMEPYRGFPTFLRAVEVLQRRRPDVHVVVGGDDGVYYSFYPPDGTKNWKSHLLGQLDLDLTRLHFTGPLPLGDLVALLRASAAHVYLSAPFIPSWSMFEAMAAGCLVVGSDNEPVRELAENGVHALLFDFHDHEALARRIEDALDGGASLRPLREAARARIVERYALAAMLARQVAMLEDVVAGRSGAEVTGSAIAGAAGAALAARAVAGTAR